MEIETLHPHGMCAGVRAAVEKAMSAAGAWCLHEPVHSELVTAALAARGVRTVEDIESVPDGATVVFSAHGVAPATRARAAEKRLSVVDATCPSVAAAHAAVRELAAQGLPAVVLGDPDHVETRGLLGETGACREPPGGGRIGVVCQTTMDEEEVRARVEDLRRSCDVVVDMTRVCTASAERQRAVRSFGGDALLVLGSRASANTRRLVEIAPCPAFLASDLGEVAEVGEELARFARVGVTSGAATPEGFFEEAVALLRGM